MRAGVQQFEQVACFERGWVRRRAQQELPDETTLAHDVAIEAGGGVGVTQAVARHLAARGVGVDIPANEITVARQGRTAAIGHDLQPVFCQVQFPVNFGTQQAADVGTVGVFPVLAVGLQAYRGAADVVVFLHHQGFQARLTQECAIGQAVVACADDNRLVFAVHVPGLLALPVEPGKSEVLTSPQYCPYQMNDRSFTRCIGKYALL